MRQINRIVVHCTATHQLPDERKQIDQILDYFLDSLKWKNVGYHVIIGPSGQDYKCCEIDGVVNGAAGYNNDSIHIAWVGGIDKAGKAVDNRTSKQKEALIRIIKQFKAAGYNVPVVGHYDLSPDQNKDGVISQWEKIKSCPCFAPTNEYKNL